MTFEEQIIEAYSCADLIKACKNIANNNWEDLRGQVLIKMLEMNQHQRDKIKSVKGFMIRSCWNLGLDIKKSKFNSLEFVQITENHHETEIVNDTFVIDRIKQDLENPKRFYNARVFVYSNVYGNVFGLYSKIKKSGLYIPYNELLKAYNEYKTYIKNYAKSRIY